MEGRLDAEKRLAIATWDAMQVLLSELDNKLEILSSLEVTQLVRWFNLKTALDLVREELNKGPLYNKYQLTESHRKRLRKGQNTMNATTQAVLRMNKQFLNSMTPIEAADKAVPLVIRLIVAEYGHNLIAEARAKSFKERIVDDVTNGERYNAAVRLALYHYVPGSEQILKRK